MRKILMLLILVMTGCSRINSPRPVLLLSTDDNFGNYTSEILKTEGFNLFVHDSVGSNRISASYLKDFEIVILAEPGPDGSFISLLHDYVKSGGRLIMIEPDSKAALAFGFKPEGHAIPTGYTGIDSAEAMGKGLPSALLQLHDSAVFYTVPGGRILAALYNKDKSKTGYPAVISSDIGRGRVIVFLYNLPENIVLTRQGNPEDSGQEKDGIKGLRAMDLFTGGWVDTSNNTINQADVQMALFSHCLENLSGTGMPLPRFWYFPDTLKCLVTLTNDGEYKSENDFEPQFRDVDSLGAKMSLYILGVDKVSKAWVDKWTKKGFEIAGHPDDTREAEDPRWHTMDSVLVTRKHEIDSAYGLPMLTNVNHWFVWCGRKPDGTPEFSAEAQLENKAGIEMDVNYAHYDMNSNQGKYYLGTPGLYQGNFTGSGLVMKFADSKGKILSIYQHHNAVYDQEYTESHDPEGFFNCFKGLMDRSLNDEAYSFISVKSHNDEYYFSKKPLMKMLTYAKQNSIPVWTELMLLDFLKMKEEASFSDFEWNGKELKFKLSSHIKNPSDISFLVPYEYNRMKLNQVFINGKPGAFSAWNFRGSKYGIIKVVPGNTYDVCLYYK